MSVLATDKNLLTLIYNSRTRLGKQALGYLQGSTSSIQGIDISKTNLGDTVWMGIQKGLGKSFDEMLSTDHPDAPESAGGKLDQNDWLKLLNKNPILLQHPIAVRGDRMQQLRTPSDLISFFDPDSAGLK